MTTHETNAKNQNKIRNRRGYKITAPQALALNASTIIGVGVLTLPRSTTEAAHQFGWISVLVALLFSVLGVYVIFKLCERFPGKTLIEFSREILGSRRHSLVGRVLSFPIGLLYAAYWGFLTAVVARMFGEVVVTAVLINTPLEVIVGTMLLLCLVMSLYEVEVVARVNEVLLIVIVVPVLFISLSAYQNARMEYIMPLLPTGSHLTGVLMGALPALTTFFGFEIMLMFNQDLKKDDDVKMLKAQIYGVLIPGIVYLLIVIAGIMSFGYEELSHQAWPTLELIKSVNVPGLILERLEAVFLGVWVAAVFTTAGNWFYCATWSSIKLIGLKKKRRHWLRIAYVVVVYFIAMKVGGNIQQLFQVLEWVGYVGVVMVLLIPMSLYIVAAVRKLDHRPQAKGKKGRGDGTRDAS